MPADSRRASVIVIGGGISGLACAYRLLRLGQPVMLLESEPHPGGLIATAAHNGFLFESGPQSFQGTDTLLRLIAELGLDSELLRADPRAPRFVLRRGRLQKIPMSPQALLASSLLSFGSRWKIASEPFRRTKPPTNEEGEESVAAFVRRKFGHEILEYLVAPFVSGVYAGDPESLSLRAAFPTLDEWEREHGSVIRGAMKSRRKPAARNGPPPLCSFRGGIAALPRAMAAALGDSFRAGARVTAIHRAPSESLAQSETRAAYQLRIAGAGDAITAQAIVLATPAYAASHLLNDVSPAIARTLSGIAYAPVAVVAAGYAARQTARAVEGFGFLVPRSERLHTLGTVWNSSLFPGRAPQGNIVMTSFLGGATDPEIVARPDDEIAAIVHRENASILEISGAPIAAVVWKYPKALPQYNLGHAHIIAALREAARRTPGIFFTGNYLEGPAIGKCIEQGFSTAESIRDFLNKV